VQRSGSGAVPDFTVTDCREYSKLRGIPARRVCLDYNYKLTLGAEPRRHPYLVLTRGARSVCTGVPSHRTSRPVRRYAPSALVVRQQPQPFFDVWKSSLDDIDLTPRSTRSVIHVPETIQCEYVQKPLLRNALGSPQLLSGARTSLHRDRKPLEDLCTPALRLGEPCRQHMRRPAR